MTTEDKVYECVRCDINGSDSNCKSCGGTGYVVDRNPDKEITLTLSKYNKIKPPCVHGRRSGLYCPWCLGING